MPWLMLIQDLLSIKPDNISARRLWRGHSCRLGLVEIDDQNENEFHLDKELHNIVEMTLKESKDSMHGTPGYIAPERYTKKVHLIVVMTSMLLEQFSIQFYVVKNQNKLNIPVSQR